MGRTSLPGGTLFRGAGAGGHAPTYRAIRGPQGLESPSKLPGHCENSGSPRPWSLKSEASRRKRVLQVQESRPQQVAQECEVGAIWGRTAEETSLGGMGEAAPGQAPPGRAPAHFCI